MECTARIFILSSESGWTLAPARGERLLSSQPGTERGQLASIVTDSADWLGLWSLWLSSLWSHLSGTLDPPHGKLLMARPASGHTPLPRTTPSCLWDSKASTIRLGWCSSGTRWPDLLLLPHLVVSTFTHWAIAHQPRIHFLGLLDSLFPDCNPN